MVHANCQQDLCANLLDVSVYRTRPRPSNKSRKPGTRSQAEGGWRDVPVGLVRCVQCQDDLPSWYLYGACANIIVLY